MVKPKQGDIYWLRFGFARSYGPVGKRPAVIIQNDLLNMSNLQTTVVCLITSNKKLSKIPGNVRLRKGMGNIPKTSVVVVTQMTAVEKTRLLEKIGTLDKEAVQKILRGCQMAVSSSIF